MPPTNILVFALKNALGPILQSLSTENSIQLLSNKTPERKPVSLVNECHNLLVFNAAEKLPFESLGFAKRFRESFPHIPIVIFTHSTMLGGSLNDKNIKTFWGTSFYLL